MFDGCQGWNIRDSTRKKNRNQSLFDQSFPFHAGGCFLANITPLIEVNTVQFLKTILEEKAFFGDNIATAVRKSAADALALPRGEIFCCLSIG